MSKVAVIGAGAWGTALAIVLGRTGVHEVRLWAYEKEVFESIDQRRVNRLFLDGYVLPKTIRATNQLAEAVEKAEIVLSAVPSHHCRRLFKEMSPQLKPTMRFVTATKGIENETWLRMSEVITVTVKEHAGFDAQIAALSGPMVASFASMAV